MNTRSSTETEHVGTSEYLPKPIFFELFMKAQGYKPKLTLAKDNLDIDFLYCQGAPYLIMKSTTIKFQAIQTFNRISRSQKKGARRNTYKRGPSDILEKVEKSLTCSENVALI